MPQTNSARADIVEFWRTVEMFSPQKVEKVDREKRVFRVQSEHPLPWTPDHELAAWKLRKNQAWQHVVYLGIFQLAEVFEVISRVFEPDKDSYDERPAGESAFAAFAVSEQGIAILDSPVLSSCAWATGQLVRHGRGGRDWGTKFEAASSEFFSTFRDLVTEEVPAMEDGAMRRQRLPRVLDVEDLGKCLAAVVDVAGTGSALSCAEIRIHSQIVARRTADTASGHEFLNSFIMGDLATVTEQTAAGNIGATLRAYLRPQANIPTSRRVDVQDRLDVVLADTAPDVVPAGRWPSPPEYPLATNQQLAVNTAVGITDIGIIGVNGPPGTGKTTMLRDLIAALVVARAERLATLADPNHAFGDIRLTWKTGQYKRVIKPLRTDLSGFEIVVASSNNGAVQNITDEIPADNAIGESWRSAAAEVDYFPEIATGLLAPEPDAKAPPADGDLLRGWAMLAARLGNRTNRGRFVTAFWYHVPDDPDDEHAWFGLLSVLKEYEQTAPDRPWSVAVADFRAAHSRVESLRAERSAVFQAVTRLAELHNELVERQRAITTAVRQLDLARERRDAAVRVERKHLAEATRIAQARQAEETRSAIQRRDELDRIILARQADAERIGLGEVANAEQTVQLHDAAATSRWQAHRLHQRSRPSSWDRLRSFGAANRRWEQENAWLATEVSTARRELNDAKGELDAARLAVAHARQDVADARRERETLTRDLTNGLPLPAVNHPPLTAARQEMAFADQQIDAALRAKDDAEAALHADEAKLARLDAQLATAAKALGQHYPDDSWWTDRERRERAALWTDQELNTARSELFLAALALHKAFLQHTATTMRGNLHAAIDVVGGSIPTGVAEQAVLAAWQNLFLVVPVISTTFASYARLFGHLGKETLGWLLIDEAGQATPQNAVGALWRTKRAVVVGDPLQLEPVVTLPFRAEQAIRNEFGVDEQWSPSRLSVQRLADRLTPLGTRLPDAEDTTWVGIPLTVHRRCDQPMFGIVNTIAYNGLMIDGTSPAAGERFTTAYPTLPPSKWIDVAGTHAQGHWIPDEGRELDRILRALADLDFDLANVLVVAPFRDIAGRLAASSRRYPGLVAGTVHTAQGKQADIVIIVLGGDPARPRAREWAASKPNLLNVAVSRAKRRLYVIGDRTRWSGERYFKVLAAKLPHSPPVRTPE